MKYRPLVTVAGLWLLACGDSYNSMPTDQVCRDTGYAIAARTLDCEADPDLADRRYQAFLRNYQCLVRDLERDPIDVYYHCASQISRASCAQVQQFGGSLRRYLTLSPTCAQFLSGPGLTPPAEENGSGSAAPDTTSGDAGTGAAP